MKILVLNCGSSSIKFQVLKMPEEKLLIKGVIERIGEENSIIESKNEYHKMKLNEPVLNHEKGIEKVLSLIIKPEFKVMNDIKEIGAIGHRVVHGGEEFSDSVIINEKVIDVIKSTIPLAPLHNPANLKGILACRSELPGIPQIAVFDTAFHQTLPDYAFRYAIPKTYYERHKIRRYGFHGTSHKYVAGIGAEILRKDIKDTKLITAHLGNGASISAIQGGNSIDTSMGFTPLEGLIMGTRSGDLDPAILIFLEKNENLSADDIDQLLNKRSGVLGLFGQNDMRILEEKYYAGDALAIFVMTLYAYRLVKYIGAYNAVLGGADALIYTAGVGENTPPLRELVAKFLAHMGLSINNELNNKVIRYGEPVDISGKDSKIKTLVIPTNEELAIARDTCILIRS
ncbi:acetate kinase [bacterium]|nr:acetate kinase [bacterium]